MTSETKTLVYSQGWNSKQEIPALSNFHDWAEQYVETSRSVLSSQVPLPVVAEGVQFAKERRTILAKLFRSNPAQAIAATVPASVRRLLPPEVVSELETRVSGTGDFTVLASLASKGGLAVEPVKRFVRLGDRTYRAYVYGRRSGQTTKFGIPLHGIAIDGVLALHEGALRELEVDEVSDAPAPSGVWSNAAIRAEVGGIVYRLASRQQLADTEARLEAAEAGIGPRPTETAAEIMAHPIQTPSTAITPSSTTWTTGNKNLLVIRVDFYDLPGIPHSRDSPTIYTATYVQNLADTQIKPYYQQSSYGLTNLTTTVTTQVYRMPETAAYYARNGVDSGLHADAEDAVSSTYSLGSYDRILVLFSPLDRFIGSQITYGGMAEVGGPNVWVNGEFDFRVVAHELGHTYGLYHGNLWQVNDGNPVSANGSSVEYGDDFDTMGSNFGNDPRTDFNPWFKNELGWLTDSQVQTVSASGTYRIGRFDSSAAIGILALKVVKDSTHNYWIGARRSFTDNSSMQNGAYIVWGYNYNTGSDLLDMTTPGNSDKDAALAIGSTFTDPSVNLAFQPVGEGGTGSGQYIDVQVSIPSTQTYTITTSSSPSNGGTTSGDGTFTAGGSQTVSATASTAYSFSNWTENGSVVSTSASYAFTLDGNRNLVASFASNPVINPPTVQTLAATSAGTTSTIINGTVTADGGAPVVARYFYYWIDPNFPTVIDDSGITVSGNDFSAQIAGLNPNATYQYRASARNSSTVDLGEGPGWGFGTAVSFMPGPTQLGNISTRLSVGTGDNVLIGGFIINGTQPKKVILRALGPALTGVGLTEVLADPTLELHDGSGALIASNDDWQTTLIGGIITADQASDIQSSGLAPAQTGESAIIVTLQPGSYTAIVRGKNDTTGIALVESYDLDRTVDSKLANISTRGLVQTGDNVMIGGIIIVGIDATKIIVRAIGPSLTSAGISNPLQDPTLELHDGNGALITFNDNWKDSQQDDIQATGLAPSNDAESAILSTLSPGSYTVIVRGKNNTSGVGLIEAYQVGN